MRLSEISQLDSALVVGSFLRKDHPLFAQRLRQLAKGSGKVSLLSVTADDPLIALHAKLTVSPDAMPLALAGVIKALAQIRQVAIPAGLESAIVCDQSRRIAESLTAGGSHAIFLGNVAEQSAHASIIHALACELARMSGARVGFIGEAANSVGGYVAEALPAGLNAYEMFARPRKAYVLMGLEPELDCHNPQMAIAALKQAALVVMLTPYRHEAASDYADVLLPVGAFSETSGTFVNTEGRAQSFAGACVPPGEARPGWKVLRVLGNVLALPGFDYEHSEQIRDEMLAGKEFVAGLDNGLTAPPLVLPEPEIQTQRIADVPIYFADALVRRATSLQSTRDAAPPFARLGDETLAQAGFSDGEVIRVRQGRGEALLTVCRDDTVPVGCVRIASGHSSTAALGDMFGPVTMERVG